MEKREIAPGYRFAGVPCGIRSGSKRPDLALVICDAPTAAAGVFTQNCVQAAPVQVCKERLPSNQIRGIVVCAGNANACTGEQGLQDTRKMARLTAEKVGCDEEQILVCSTGIIGVNLPMSKVEAGIKDAATKLDNSPEAFQLAAESILTTDTKIKVSTKTVEIGGEPIQVTGFAKGAAMIGPNMATMLAFVLTNAPVGVEELSDLVKSAAANSFNCICVEGHTSTNDTLLLLANGQGPPLQGKELAQFCDCVLHVCKDLAKQIIRDAEGASHLIQIEVEGLRNDAEAHRVAKTVADSALVKTAIFGADPNWGRIISAAGYSGVEFAESQVSLWLGETLLYKAGVPQKYDESAVSRWMKDTRELTMTLRFSLGNGRCTFFTSDLTYEYVRLNAEYTT